MFKKLKNMMNNKSEREDKNDILAEDPKTVANEQAEGAHQGLPEPTELELAQAEIESLKAQVFETKDKYMRLVAEFDNFRKRKAKEQLDVIKHAGQDIMSAILPVLDDFDRAKKNAETEGSNEHFSEGIALVYHKLQNTLKNKGLEAIAVETGDDFDLELHEAITEIAAPSEELKGKVIDTVEKGYKLNDKIIRYAKVVVGR
jgi:molecular chaperone GrpE